MVFVWTLLLSELYFCEITQFIERILFTFSLLYFRTSLRRTLRFIFCHFFVPQSIWAKLEHTLYHVLTQPRSICGWLSIHEYVAHDNFRVNHMQITCVLNIWSVASDFSTKAYLVQTFRTQCRRYPYFWSISQPWTEIQYMSQA